MNEDAAVGVRFGGEFQLQQVVGELSGGVEHAQLAGVGNDRPLLDPPVHRAPRLPAKERLPIEEPNPPLL